MKLHIGNLPKSTTESELKELIGAFGQPATLEIIKDSDGSSKGFGFVEFSDNGQAQAAIAGLDGKDVGGRTLRVSEARPRRTDGPRH
ncbi:MAG: RNA-binding protein [Thermoanaerobaculia bacterium]